MPSPEDYWQRAKEARNQAKACRHDWERQGLLIIADQCERLAAYKDLTTLVTAPAGHPAGVRPRALTSADVSDCVAKLDCDAGLAGGGAG
jgi:hypothetical protein